MHILLKLVCLVAFFACACAEYTVVETGRKKSSYGLLYGGGLLYYLTFLIIKVKLVAVVGTLIAVALFAGKIFAFFKYLAVYDHGHYGHHSDVIYSEPPTHYSSFGKEVILDHPPSSYGSDHSSPSYDSNPYGTDHIPEDVHKYSKYGGRSNDGGETDIFDLASRAFQNLKLTEFAFDAMHIKDEDCKKKFLCEAMFKAKDSQLLSYGLSIFNDTSQSRYQPRTTPESLEECQALYPTCQIDVQS